MDTDRLRVYVFPFLLTGTARKWWINEGSDKITTWSEAVGRFFCFSIRHIQVFGYDVLVSCTDLAGKKSTMLVEYLLSGILRVL
ncbi:hypothetical protein Tco_0517218 [Tanacetum coccineum]